ncbi:MAG: hypothetical protein ISR45_12555 [Rhodospirillales bacterium]|nr:hypothetical protein [Rhodospirillales bacterium]
MHIGIDFDNTIAGYDSLIRLIAVENGWIENTLPGGKRNLRDTIRHLPDGEGKWMALQAEIYGPRMGEAVLIDGVGKFLQECRDKSEKVSIISHKSKYAAAAPGGVDLREAALAWMEGHQFFPDSGFGLARENVHFADTRGEKCQRIAALGCDLFIDDLHEVFADIDFPVSVEKILFETEPGMAVGPEIQICTSWSEIRARVFGEDRGSG